uniref:Uncharacterized protein n=1 Tax=Romanomermis culicivorax TaxID=13658 RepID=A0A915I8I5_ROMCU
MPTEDVVPTICIFQTAIIAIRVRLLGTRGDGCGQELFDVVADEEAGCRHRPVHPQCHGDNNSGRDRPDCDMKNLF